MPSKKRSQLNRHHVAVVVPIDRDTGKLVLVRYDDGKVTRMGFPNRGAGTPDPRHPDPEVAADKAAKQTMSIRFGHPTTPTCVARDYDDPHRGLHSYVSLVNVSLIKEKPGVTEVHTPETVAGLQLERDHRRALEQVIAWLHKPH